MHPPIIIIGLPRSGTTLLRVLLGTHSKIHGTLEMPWITGSWGPEFPSVHQLLEHLDTDELSGTAALEGIHESDVFEAGKRFVDTLLEAHLTEAHKDYLVLKTPDDIGQIDFLLKLFSESKYIHICRDGRDVAASTVNARAEMGVGVPTDAFGRITIMTALQRWCDWETLVRKKIAEGKISNCISVTYEELVFQPGRVMRRICGFLELEYEKEMLDYRLTCHNLPEWDLGSRGVLSKSKIDTQGVGRWKQVMHPVEMIQVDKHFGACLKAFGYHRCSEQVNLADGLWARLTWSSDRFLEVIIQLLKASPNILYRVAVSVKRTIAVELRDMWFR